MTILFLTTVLPAAPSTGGEIASRAFVDALRASGNRVVVIGYLRPGPAPGAAPGDWPAGRRRIETGSGGIAPLAWFATSVALRLPYSVAKYRSRRYRRLVRRALGELAPDHVIVDHAQAAGGLPRAGLRAPHVYLAHNVEHHLYRDAAERSRGPLRLLHSREARRIRAVERQLAAGAREVWALTEADAEELRRIAAGRVRVFALPPTVSAPRAEEIRYDVAMLGTWSWEANAAGLRWFAEEVQPLLPEGTTVGVGGRGAAEVVGGRAGVACAGFVEDPAAFLAAGRVVVVPAVAGSGIQVKTLDAIAAGRPTVATPLALRGIDSPPATVRAAGSAPEMATAIAELLRAAKPEPDPAAGDWARRRREVFTESVREAVAGG